MAVEKAGVLLVAEGYSTYLNQLQTINKLQQQTFGSNAFKDFQKASDGLTQQSQKINKSFESTQKVMDNLRDRLQPVKSDMLGSLTQSLDEALKSANPLQSTLSSLGNFISSTLSSQFLAFGGVLVGVFSVTSIKAFIDSLLQSSVAANTAFEKYETQFQTFLGTADAAKKRIGELAKFGETTPYELPEVVQASKTLQTFGGSKLATGDSLREIGDAAAATSASFQEVAFWSGRMYSAIQAGRPFGEAAMRFQELGILTADTRNKLEAMQKSGKSANEVWKAFTDDINQRFAGAMDRLSKTFEGVSSNIADFQGKLVREGGGEYFDTLRKQYIEFYDVVSKPETSEALTELAKSLGAIAGTVRNAIFQPLIDGLKDIQPDDITHLASTFGDFNSALKDISGISLPSFAELPKAIDGVVESAAGLIRFADILKNVSLQISGLKGAFELLNKYGVDLTKVLMPVVNPLLGIGDAVDTLNKQLEKTTGRSIEELLGGKDSETKASNLAELYDKLSSIFQTSGEQIDKAGRSASTFIAELMRGDNAKTIYQQLYDYFKTLGESEYEATTKARQLTDSISSIKAGTATADLSKQYEDLTKKLAEASAGEKGDADATNASANASKAAAEALKAEKKAIQDKIDALESTANAYKKLDQIDKQYTESWKKAGEDYQKSKTEGQAKYDEQRIKSNEKFNAKLTEFDENTAKSRAKMIDDFNRSQAQSEQQYNQQRAQAVVQYNQQRAQAEQQYRQQQQQAEDQYELQKQQSERQYNLSALQAYQNFQLSMEQASRKHNISDKRLRAEGDVLALMESREDYDEQQKEATENYNLSQQQAKDNYDNQRTTADENYKEQQKASQENFDLQQQQAKENFDLQQQMAADSYAAQTAAQQQQFEIQLQEFDAAQAEQRQKLLDAHAQELADMEASWVENQAMLAEQYKTKLAMIEEQKLKELEALGEALNEEGTVTEEGMKAIAGKIDDIFGDNKAADALIKGWANRTDNELAQLVDNAKKQIETLKKAMESVGNTTTTSSTTTGGGGSGTSSGSSNYTYPKMARTGFQGIVTGPQTFQVEPGVREQVNMVPLSKFNGSVSVGGDIGVNVSGMTAGVSAEMEQTIATNVLDEIKVAIKRLSRRGS